MHSPAGALSNKCIGGAPSRALSPRRWEQYFGRLRRCHAGRLFSQIVGQSGRSMLEMLAVLAIMGVLAIGGIAAYSFAVSKHRANQIYNQVDLRAVTAFSNPIMRHTIAGNTFFLPGFEDTFENLTYEQTKRERTAFEIKVSNVPQKVCKRLQDMTFKLPRQVTLNGEDISSACGTQNTFVFVYDGLSVGKPSSGVDPIDCTCSGCQSCESGVCRDNDNLCGPKEVCVSGTCQCAPDYTECRGGCYTTCTDGLIRDPISCDCVCEAQECPDFALWDNDTCACVCQSPLTYDALANACVCPTGYSGPFDDGSCQRLYCVSPRCYLNDDLCGYQCDDEARGCTLATCWPQECAAGTSLQHVPDGKQIPGGYRWACRIEGTSCFIRRSSDIYCFNGSVGEYPCCRADSLGNCERGMCGDVACPANGQKVQLPADDESLNGCAYEDNVRCLAIAYENGSPSVWQCRKNGIICSTNCTNPPECDGACVQTICPDDSVWQGDMCCKNGVCCDYETNKCFIGENQCGSTCYAQRATFADCLWGLCLNICPASTEWAYDSRLNTYTCQREGFSCINQSSATEDTPLCYYNGERCGSKCDYDATNCQNVFMEACAPDVTYDGVTKKACVYHKTVTETCFCDTALDTPVGTLCCPAGHVIENGGCSIPLST